MQQATRLRRDGFSLIELLIVIVILGLLATLVVFAVRGISEDAGHAACDADKHSLETAIEGFFAMKPADEIPGDDTTDNREQALMAFGLLRQPSKLYDVTANGDLVTVASGDC